MRLSGANGPKKTGKVLFVILLSHSHNHILSHSQLPHTTSRQNVVFSFFSYFSFLLCTPLRDCYVLRLLCTVLSANKHGQRASSSKLTEECNRLFDKIVTSSTVGDSDDVAKVFDLLNKPSTYAVARANTLLNKADATREMTFNCKLSEKLVCDDQLKKIRNVLHGMDELDMSDPDDKDLKQVYMKYKEMLESKQQALQGNLARAEFDISNNLGN